MFNWTEFKTKSKQKCGAKCGKLFSSAIKNGLKMIMKKKPTSFSDAYKIAHKAVRSCFKRKKVPIPRVIPVPKTGGVLPLVPILTALGALGGIASGGSAVAKVLNDIKNGREQLAEATRHNRYMESIAMGKGLYLKPYKQGYGLFLRPQSKNY